MKLGVAARVAARCGLPEKGVDGCVRLLSEGNTVPFIARYRKEATGGLDETAIRRVQEALEYVTALDDRKKTVLAAIEKAGRLTDELRRLIEECEDRQELEDLYLPFKQKKSTRADAARKAGLEPLARIILGLEPCPAGARLAIAQRFVRAVEGASADSPEAALAGARDIVAEVVATNPPVRRAVRDLAGSTGRICSARKRGAGEEEAAQFADYFERSERVADIPAHRILAMLRGETAGALSVKVEVPERRALALIQSPFFRRVPSLFTQDFEAATEDGFTRLLWPSVERELLGQLKERADRSSVAVFEENLRSLLMEPPARGKRVLGIDPGFRNGCKLAVVDDTGKVLGAGVIYPHPPQENADEAKRRLVELCLRHRFDVAGVGDGTAHRETMAFVATVAWPTPVAVTPVREAGASVYSASEVAVAELPELDVTLRGAVSIARRYQDPLAELVKIEPKSIGVGQYQHDVDQGLLESGLSAVVEECVNRVGVELNTASPALLSHVAGIGPTTARAIVAHRDSKGPFRNRAALLKVAGIGPARFLQCAGFLRIPEGVDVLDRTGIHPERYEAVGRAARAVGLAASDLLGNPTHLSRLKQQVTATALGLGVETWSDILAELERPGRDPRGERKEFRFSDRVHALEDLEVGMVLPGRVNSVTDFGAFVDIGVHRDGLVHVSRMADRRVSSPFEVCRPGMVVTVKVVEVDRKRGRIGLSMKPSEVGGTG
ncbi:MAG: RNA-binding transcriptional accessory protein [Deltaproteobacteria bacterium]|nr:RNA-binding transcriptional accessory protein [Deltaproteobacteria bacterium]